MAASLISETPFGISLPSILKKSLTMSVCSHNGFWNKSARLILLRSIWIRPQGEMNSCIVTNASSKTQTQWTPPSIRKKSLTMCVCSHNAFWNKSARLILLRSIGISPQGEMNSCIVTNASSKTQTQWTPPSILVE